MTLVSFRRRTAAWLALAAMALNAAWPLLANAQPAVPASPSEICSATGLNHASDGAPADPSKKHLHASHCSFCSFHAERGLAITAAGQPLIASDPPGVPVSRRSDAPSPGIAHWPAAPPRAPPFRILT